MPKPPTPKVDHLRAMREARHEEQRLKRQAEVKELQRQADEVKPKPVKRPKKKKVNE